MGSTTESDLAPGLKLPAKTVFVCCWFLAMMAIARPALPNSASIASAQEYRIKAAFLYKFLLFTEIPPAAPANQEDTIALCVIGSDPPPEAFAEIVGKPIRGKSLRIRYLDTDSPAESLANCHILFFAKVHEQSFHRLLSRLGENPVVSVGEISGFLESGGLINFLRQGKRITFEINRQAAAKSGVKFRSSLLRVAHRVIEGQGS